MVKYSVDVLHALGWKPTVAFPFQGVIMSRFCREALIRSLHEAREKVWPELFDDATRARDRSFESEFCMVAEDIRADLGYSSDLAVQLHHINFLFSITSTIDAEKQAHLYLDLSASVETSPLSEVLSKQSGTEWKGAGLADIGKGDYQHVYGSISDSSKLWEPSTLDEVVSVNAKIIEAGIAAASFVFIDATLADLSTRTGDRFLEKHSKKYLFASTAVALDKISTGGWLVIRIGDMMTRPTVGLVYLLYLAFARVQVLKPWTCSLWKPERFIVCQGFKGPSTGFVDHLKSAFSTLASCDYDTEDVLDICPMPQLLQSNFYPSFARANERMTHREICMSLRLQYCLASPY